jgi:uncharacterized membrane protein YcaP (DUF421 family)
MIEFSPTLLEIALRTFIVYVVVVLGLRFFGKRELGQMTPFDLVLILLVSNAVQNAMTGPDTSLTGGVVSALTLLLTNWAFNAVGVRIPAVRKWLEGEPSILVQDGHIFYDHLKHEGVEMDELMMAAREHGVDRISEIGKAVLEVDGTISIVPADEDKKHAAAHLGWRTRRRKRVHR